VGINYQCEEGMGEDEILRTFTQTMKIGRRCLVMNFAVLSMEIMLLMKADESE